MGGAHRLKPIMTFRAKTRCMKLSGEAAMSFADVR